MLAQETGRIGRWKAPLRVVNNATLKMRFLGVDFGEKRVGLAVSDADASLATPLSTLTRRSDAQVIDELTRLVADEEIGAIVVGEPRGPGGSRGEAAERARSFARKLELATGLPVRLVDETLTSHAAAQRLGSRKRRGRREQGRLDAVAAQIILQQALDARQEAP